VSHRNGRRDPTGPPARPIHNRFDGTVRHQFHGPEPDYRTKWFCVNIRRLLSRGGGIFDRHAKSLTLAPELIHHDLLPAGAGGAASTAVVP